MKPRYITELAEGSRVDAVFVLRSKEVRAARSGDAYLALALADRTGAIPAVHFRPDRLAASIPAGSVVRVTGTVTTYRGRRRISVETMVPAETWDPTELIAASPRPIDELSAEFRALARSVHDRGLRQVLRSVFGDARFFERFCRCPASLGEHHAYLGGLLEHTVSVTSGCALLSERYKEVDRDLLVSAALLHDVGRVDEISFDVAIATTDDGRFIGHAILGAQRVRRALERVRLAPRVSRRLEHAVLFHHGASGPGSLGRPSTLEALILGHADDLDAAVAGFAQVFQRASLAGERWTDDSNVFGRSLWASPVTGEGFVRIAGASEDTCSTVA